jgi:hypothetical protein
MTHLAVENTSAPVGVLRHFIGVSASNASCPI